MKKYRVNVNGTAYEVEIEEMAGAPVAAPVAAPAAAPAPAASGAGESINAPMPGNILSVNVAAGDTVKKGQVVAIVEAMKLMNEIESEVDGVIAEVLVKNGEMVDYGKPLFRVKA